MVNIVNVFWGLAALLTGSLFTYFLWAFVVPAIAFFAAEGTLMYTMTMIGMIVFTIFWVLAVPILTVIAEEDGGLFKRMLDGKIGE